MSKLRPSNPQRPLYGPHPNIHLPTRGSLISINFLSKHVWSDSSVPRFHLLSSHKGSTPAGCPEDRYSVCGIIWQYPLGGQGGVKPCALPARMQMECSAGSLFGSIYSSSTVPIILLSVIYLNTGQAFRLANYVCHQNKLIAGAALSSSSSTVPIILLSVKYLNTGQAFRLANYVCHQNRLIAGAALSSWSVFV